ncbi:MAG: alpha/beta hydrolase [Verrucomicrobiota bacterium]|nr:alpha/beta hydrolase [Verrucomicrobiota bacterium]
MSSDLLTLPLWPAEITATFGADTERDLGDSVLTAISHPTLTVLLPKPSGSTGLLPAIIVCPGGGYNVEVFDREGLAVARRFVELGFVGAVLKYRLVRKDHRDAIEDAHQAVRLLRQHASEWSVDKDNIGLLGFSAGGHLTVSAALTAKANAKPNWMAPIYPGTSKLPADVVFNEESPAAFLVHTGQDQMLSPANSIRIYEKLHACGVPAALHVFTTGAHGIDLGNPATGTDAWPALLAHWVKAHQWKQRAEVVANEWGP